MSDCREIDCRTAVQQLWDYLDQELTPERMNDVRGHLERCKSCLPHHDYAQAFLAALSAAKESEARAPDALRRRVMDNLRAAGFSA
jgi:mycothiol system anti-sigma-R factor